jgi:DNA-binding transcriptional ArsR family regulator
VGAVADGGVGGASSGAGCGAPGAAVLASAFGHGVLEAGVVDADHPRSWTSMSEPRDELILDRLIHEPGRLAILTVLSSVRDADFVFLQRTTGLTKGNLSSHLTKLEDAGLIEIEKRFIRKKPNTNVALTAVGRQRIAHHWDQLERLKNISETARQLRR